MSKRTFSRSQRRYVVCRSVCDSQRVPKQRRWANWRWRSVSAGVEPVKRTIGSDSRERRPHHQVSRHRPRLSVRCCSGLTAGL